MKDLLKNKLREEVEEFCQSEKIDEIADILEVIRAICAYYGIDQDQVEKLREDKLAKRGGFERRVVLDES